jgi:hypothetical protein
MDQKHTSDLDTERQDESPEQGGGGTRQPGDYQPGQGGIGGGGYQPGQSEMPGGRTYPSPGPGEERGRSTDES